MLNQLTEENTAIEQANSLLVKSTEVSGDKSVRLRQEAESLLTERGLLSKSLFNGENCQLQQSIQAYSDRLKNTENILETFLEDTKLFRIIGEHCNKVAIFIIFVSNLFYKFSDSFKQRYSKTHCPDYLEKDWDSIPGSVIVKGQSSEGKNFLLDGIARFFPEDMFFRLGSVSKQAFIYDGKENSDILKRKIIITNEAKGLSEGFWSVSRELLSEGKVTRRTVVGGQTLEITLNGPVSIATTTSTENIEVDDENRVTILSLEGKKQHSSAIVESCFSRFCELPKYDLHKELTLKGYKYFCDELVKEPCVIRFPRATTFLCKFDHTLDHIKGRRKMDYFFIKVITIALLRRFQKTSQGSVEGVPVFNVDKTDYTLAYDYFKNMIEDELSQLSRKEVHALNVVCEHYENTTFNRVELKEKLDRGMTYTHEVCSALLKSGVIEIDKERGEQGEHRYNFNRCYSENRGMLLPAPDDLFKELV